MNNYYQFLNQISLPKHNTHQTKNYNVQCQTKLNTLNKIEQEIKYFKDQSTQCDLTIINNQSTQCEILIAFDKSTQYEDFVQSQIVYTNGLLSQMESVNLIDFQTKLVESIQQSSILLNNIQQNNYSIYNQVINNINQEFVQFIIQYTNNKQMNEIKNLLQQYTQLIQLIQQGLEQPLIKQYSIVDQLSFNENYNEQQSPGWLLTPTIKVTESHNFLSDSMIEDK